MAMWITMLLPLGIGAILVLQAVLNRQISNQVGLASAVLVNQLVATVVSLAFWFWIRSSAVRSSDPLFRSPESPSSFAAWYLIPGVLGFLIVAGIPAAIQRVGAMRSFVTIIGAQILCSLLWDALVEQVSLPPLRWIGAVVTFIGAVLVNLANS